MFRFSLDAKGLGCDITIIARLHIKFGCHPTTKKILKLLVGIG